jgi:hypothetical protein
MLNKTYTVIFISCVCGAVYWVFSSGILERFRTIEAQCSVGGFGNLSIQHQYTSTTEKSILVMNDQQTVNLQVELNKNTLQLKSPELQGKLNLETQALFITLGNKSYTGKCKIKQFSM